MLYTVDGWTTLGFGSKDTDNGSVISITANRERLLFAVVKPSVLHIYFIEPLVALATLTRPADCVSEKGQNVSAIWKGDSSCLALYTTKTYILFYRIYTDTKDQAYFQRETSLSQYRRTTQELLPKAAVPRIQISATFAVELPTVPTRIVAIRDELVVTLIDGWIRRLFWNGSTAEDLNLLVQQIPFGNDQLQSKADYVGPNIYVTDIAYSPLIGGFAVVFSDGRAGLLTSANVKFPQSHVHGVWAVGVSDALCASVNHKYRLLVFGCRDGTASCFSVDEITGALGLTHKMQPSDIKDYSVTPQQLGTVKYLCWSPYGEALTTAWEHTGVALWSVFGSLLWCYIPETSLLSKSSCCLSFSAMEWGVEGYRLIVGCSSTGPDSKVRGSLQYVKCMRVAHGCPTASGSSIVLIGESELYLALVKQLNSSNLNRSMMHWDITQVPYSYIGACWPLRYCALDSSELNLAVAGSKGFAHCNLNNRRWRLFGNETQEREIVISGGLCWWRDFVVAVCLNNSKQLDEIRLYPKLCNLDNMFCTTLPLSCQVLQTSVQGDVLLTFDVEGRVCLFGALLVPSNSYPRAAVLKFAEILIGELIPHPICVTSIQLTSLNHESNDQLFCDGADTLLVNIAGRLIMIHPEKRCATPEGSGSRLNQPMLIASFVEKVWCSEELLPEKPHLSKALWLHCGSRGMKVWMPLFPKESRENHQFISKRIMLPFELSVYPLSISNQQCLISGVETLSHCEKLQSSKQTDVFYLQRNSEVALHHILRQLLKRNLGLYALEIGRTCQDLPYFSHVLELLLHTVLEEEAVSAEPIPDALLPRVVAFIQEFPQFLQTVAHCARKTEMALWTHLFGAVGNPTDLFEICLRENRLETASSYLIVLQNMESANESKGHATRLLEATLDGCQWAIAKEIVRFLKSIDPGDIDTPPRTAIVAKQSRPHAGALVSPVDANDAAEAFIFQPGGLTRQRFQSISTSPESPPGHDVVPTNSSAGATNLQQKQQLARAASVAKTHSAARERHSYSGEEHPVHFYINLILTRCARELLASYRLFDLGCFSAHLEFHLVVWLSKERNRAARIQDFVAALKRTHSDFKWPLPILRHSILDYLNKKMQLNLSLPKSDQSLEKPLHVSTGGHSHNGEFIDTDIAVLNGSEQSRNGGEKTSKDQKQLGRTRKLLMEQQCGESPSYPLIVEAQLLKEESVCGTEMTEDSWLDSETTSWEDNHSSSGDAAWEAVEQLCSEAANRGSSDAEVELRYLQQIALEAGCLEWSLIICLVLRDLVGLSRAVNFNTLCGTSPDIIQHLLTGISALENWAEKHCLGYKPLLTIIQNHLNSVTQLLGTTASRKPSLGTAQPQTVCTKMVSPSEQLKSPTSLLLHKTVSADDQGHLKTNGNCLTSGLESTQTKPVSLNSNGLRNLESELNNGPTSHNQRTEPAVAARASKSIYRSTDDTALDAYNEKMFGKDKQYQRNLKPVSMNYFPTDNHYFDAGQFGSNTDAESIDLVNPTDPVAPSQCSIS